MTVDERILFLLHHIIAMGPDECRYGQSRRRNKRLDEIDEMIETDYALKGWEIPGVHRSVR